MSGVKFVKITSFKTHFLAIGGPLDFSDIFHFVFHHMGFRCPIIAVPINVITREYLLLGQILGLTLVK